MTELLTAAQMRAIEKAAIDSGEVTGLELMERAGQGVVEAIFEEWPELAPAPGGGAAPTPPKYLATKEKGNRAVVLCGPGNNGGDGFVVARLLKERGWDVEVFLYGDAEKLPEDAKVNYERWLGMGQVGGLTIDAVSSGKRPVLLVDAMFGTGLTRSIPLELANAFHAVEQRDVGGIHPWRVPYHIVAIDCPSGFDCDSGKYLIPAPPEEPDDPDDGKFPKAWSNWWRDDASRRLLNVNMTAVFHRWKVGFALTEILGKVQVVDIGLGKEERHPSHLFAPQSPESIRALDFDVPKGKPNLFWPGSELKKERSLGRHKYDHGHGLILSGGVGRGGAARLAARGALRIGAGVVTVGCPPSALQENAGALDAVMVRSVKDAEGLAEALQDGRINALCLGPGLGVKRAAELVAVALGGGGVKPRPTVLDADALTAMAGDEGLFGKLHENCVLTPHAGEFARMFPDIAEKLNAPATIGPAYSKVDATREAAARAGCVVLFKGADTVIAAPDGRCSINSAHYERSAPWLATAGSGDVLAGFITGLLARGFAPMQAAETGAWLHVECALKFGPGLIAEDLPEQLPAVFGDLGV